jgi:hypothetical protein
MFGPTVREQLLVNWGHVLPLKPGLSTIFHSTTLDSDSAGCSLQSESAEMTVQMRLAKFAGLCGRRKVADANKISPIRF